VASNVPKGISVLNRRSEEGASNRSRAMGRNLASPYMLAAAGLCMFFIAWCFPPLLYEHIMGEPNLIFLDLPSLLLYLLCVAAFVAGVRVYDFVSPGRFWQPPRLHSKIPPVLFCILPLLLCLVFEFASVAKLLTEHPDISYYLLTQQGDYAKVESESEGIWAFAPALLTATAWWVFWRSGQLNMGRWSRRLVSTAVAVSILIAVSNAILKASRTDLIPIVIGSLTIYMVRRAATNSVTKALAVKSAIALVLLVTFFFLVLSALRGATGIDSMLYQVLGYSVASFNRLSAVLHGQLRFPFAGRGVYLYPFFAFNGTLNSIFHQRQLLGFPEFQDVWRSEFGAVSEAGLDASMIWATAFGYVFAEIGWASPIYVFVIGLFYGWAWKKIRAGESVGITVYPLLAFCVIFWIGTNYVFESKTLVFLLCGMVLHAYESVLAGKADPGTLKT
jgi:hypothetical protein